MSNLYVCKRYETPYEEGFKVVKTLEEHDANVRKQTIDEFVDNLIRNSRTEIIDGDIQLVVTEKRIITIAKVMKVETDE